MNTETLLSPAFWAEKTFGAALLKEMRRSRRAVHRARPIAENASASLPAQMQSWKETKALCRLLDEPDTTEIALSHRSKMSGVGQIDDAKGRGLRLANSGGRKARYQGGLGMCRSTPICSRPSSCERAAQNRRVQTDEEEIDHLLALVRTRSSQAQQPFEVPASHRRQGRQTTLHTSFGHVCILPPCNDPRGSKEPLNLWAVRVWEEETPEGEEALCKM